MYIHTYIHIDMGLCRYAQAHVDMSQLQQVMVIGCRSRSWRRQRYHAEENVTMRRRQHAPPASLTCGGGNVTMRRRQHAPPASLTCTSTLEERSVQIKRRVDPRGRLGGY
jgi:hypothetical protein